VLDDTRMDELETVKKRIHERDDTVGAVGLGYVGLSLLLRFAETSFRVTESRV
jgi:UDP-N-acetyl-D-mannosaminuronate dehydrogenase